MDYNRGDTHEAKRVRAEASTESGQTPPESGRKERVTDAGVCEQSLTPQRVSDERHSQSTTYITYIKY